MEQFTQCVKPGVAGGNAAKGVTMTGRLLLPFAGRQKTRQRAVLEGGEEVAIVLPRGTVMRGGDHLVSLSQRVIEVQATMERVSTLKCEDAESLARGAYHLGNRHVWVQVGPGWLRYLADHVLDDMLRGLGLPVTSELAPFEPEGGAYSSHGASLHPAAHDHHHTGESAHQAAHAAGHDHSH